MRISIIRGDKDFTPNPRVYTVTLNGIKQTKCLIADSDKGCILRYKRNRFGLLSRNKQGKLETETVFGKVDITNE